MNKSLAKFNKNIFHQGFLTGMVTINLHEFIYTRCKAITIHYFYYNNLTYTLNILKLHTIHQDLACCKSITVDCMHSYSSLYYR